jgi:hypothetical protein
MSRRREVAPSMSTRRAFGRLNAITRLINVLLPDPLDPTSAVVVPAGAVNETPRNTGCPSLYSNHTLSNATSPLRRSIDARCASSSTSVGMSRISRIRSRPANASVICVPSRRSTPAAPRRDR